MLGSTKFECKNIWKLFGPDAEKFLTKNPNPSLEEIKQAGLVPAVRDANVEVEEGEIFVIMGLSGSGKSTLIRCMSRLIEPTHGELMLDGVDLRNISDKRMIEIRRHKLGMVFQHFALLPHLNILKNVAFPLTIQGVSVREAEKRAEQVIELVGLKGYNKSYPRELSGGQQQRVGIARSLAVEPELWFLDEPFSALDPLIRREMQDEFLRLQAMLKKTIIFITHDFDEAIRLADRIAIMKDGKIIQIATPEDLILNPADNYVEEFTKHVSRAKILSVKSVMSSTLCNSEEEVDGSAKIVEVAEQIVAAKTPIKVVQNGQAIGSIDAKKIIEILVKQV